MKSLKEKEARVKLKFSDDKVNICYSKDVKEAVLEFEKYLKDYIKWLRDDITIKKLNKKYFKKYGNPIFSINIYKKIFGDWEK